LAASIRDVGALNPVLYTTAGSMRHTGRVHNPRTIDVINVEMKIKKTLKNVKKRGENKKKR